MQNKNQFEIILHVGRVEIFLKLSVKTVQAHLIIWTTLINSQGEGPVSIFFHFSFKRVNEFERIWNL